MAETMGEYLHLDPSFARLVNGNMRLHRLWTGAAWAEGPVWFRDGDYLLFSDIPNNRILRFVPDHSGLSGTVSVYRQPSNNTNGHTRDYEGRLVSCEHGGRRVSRTEHDGAITALAERWQGKRLNSPNDVVVKSDGTIWFTDPPYGILTDLEGWQGELDYGGCHVFCFDPASGELRVAADDFDKPNGIAFSPDEKILYVADTGASHDPDGPRHIRAFDVTDKGKLKKSRVFATCDAVFFTGDDPAVLRAARAARLLVVTARRYPPGRLRRARAFPAGRPSRSRRETDRRAKRSPPPEHRERPSNGGPSPQRRLHTTPESARGTGRR